MAEKKKKYPVYAVGPAAAKYVHLTVPQTKYKKDGEFSLNLLFRPDDPQLAQLRAQVEAGHEAALIEARKENPELEDKTNIFKADTEKDDEGNKIPTGLISVKFAHLAQGKKKDGTIWKFRPAVFDSAGVPVPASTEIYDGSQLFVSFGMKHTLMPTGAFYTSLPLQGVQIHTLRDSFQKAASSYGFGTVQGGYVQDGEDAFGEKDEESGPEEQHGPIVADF